MSDYDESCGLRIKEMRQRRGLSQAQLAGPELSDSYISLIESGKRTPAPGVLELLAARLGCSRKYLVDGVTSEQVEEIELGLKQARLALEHGDPAEARGRYSELLAASELTRLPEQRRVAEFGLALAAEALGDVEDAIAGLMSLGESEWGKDPQRRIEIAVALSRCHRGRHDLHQATRVAEEIFDCVMPEWSEAMVELGVVLMAVYAERGDLLRAWYVGEEVQAGASTVGRPGVVMCVYWMQASIAAEDGRVNDAIELAARALAADTGAGEPRDRARLVLTHAQIVLAAQPVEVAECRDMLVKLNDDLQEVAGATIERAECAHYLARSELMLGSPKRALEHLYAVLARIELLPRSLQLRSVCWPRRSWCRWEGIRRQRWM